MRLRVIATVCLTAAFLFGFAGSARAATFLNGSGALMNIGDTLQIRDDGFLSTAGVDLDITLTDYVIPTATWTFVVTVVSGGLGGDDLEALGVTITGECDFAFWPNVNCLDGAGTIVDGSVTVTAPAPGVFQAQEIFSFDAGGDGLLNAGDTSDRLFVSYGHPLLRTTGNPPESVVSFMINPAAIGVGDQNVTNRVIPEPSVLLLLGLGIVGLAVGERRRRA